MDAAVGAAAPTRVGRLERFFGPVLRRFARRFFEPVRFPPEAEERLARVAREGYVVHVMPASGYLRFLYLLWALIRRGLPPLRAAMGVKRWWFKPFRRVQTGPLTDTKLAIAFEDGGSALVFLRAPYVGSVKGRTLEDPFPALVALQRRVGRPIYVVPELLIWEPRPAHLVPSIWDVIFGSPEARGKFAGLVAFLRNYRRASFRTADPIDLRAFLAGQPGESDEVVARKVRGALHHHFARETRAVLGPPLKRADRVIEEVLRDRSLKDALEAVARVRGRRLEAVTADARRNLGEIAASYSPALVRALAPILRWVFRRIYDGIEVDEPGLLRALEAARKAPLVLCPSHKSHVDYLILSYVLFERGVTPPHVAAGANLSFWPFGPIARRGGAFFLRRSFKGDKVYAASFRAYVKKLIHDGYAQEFYIEGGRSRTGKLLAPKLGMVTMHLEAIAEGARDDLAFVPVAIDYERIVEARSYAHELAGGEKKAESVRDLFSTPKVLRRRYGRIYLAFDEPVSLAAFLRARGLSAVELTGEEKRAAVRALAQRIMYGISRVQTITPSALVAAALLAHPRRGITSAELAAHVQFLRALAARDGARLSPVLAQAPSDPLAVGPIREALAMMQDDGAVSAAEAGGETIFAVKDDERPHLAFYKNNLLPLVTARSLVALALLARGGEAAVEELSDRALALSRLFKFELAFRVGAPFGTIFADTVEDLAGLGLLKKADGRLRAATDPEAADRLSLLCGLLRDLLEAYRAVAAALPRLRDRALDRKEFVRLALERGRVDFLAGRIRCRESLSKPVVENAVLAFAEQGLFAAPEDKGTKLTLTETARQPGRIEAVLAEIDAFLGPSRA